LKLIHDSKFNKFKILGIKNHMLKIYDYMKEVKGKVANDVFMTLIKQARNQALKIYTGRPEAIGERYLGKIDIIGKEFNMEFMVSAPNNFIEDAKQEIQRLNKVVDSLMHKEASYQRRIKIYKEKINRLEDKQGDLEAEFKLRIEELSKKLEECRPTQSQLHFPSAPTYFSSIPTK
jgi:serine phosphatase RsbU (regulator of sigma subunit)